MTKKNRIWEDKGNLKKYNNSYKYNNNLNIII